MDRQFPLLIFDEECPLCLRFKNSLERLSLEKPVYYAPLQDVSLYLDIPKLSRDEVMSEVHLVFDAQGDRILKGAEVIQYLIKLHPTVKQFSWLLETQAGQVASQTFYNAINTLRGSLRNHCPKCKNRNA